jgi:hypothetical protein
MNNNNMVNGNGLNVTESRKRITPDVLQELFMDYARELCAERLGDVKECSSYKEHSEETYEEYRCWFDALFEWIGNIKSGKILRVLKFVGAYDDHEINRDRFLTALRTLCYIARFDDDFDGKFFSCEGGLYEIPYDYLYRLERFVRTAV